MVERAARIVAHCEMAEIQQY